MGGSECDPSAEASVQGLMGGRGAESGEQDVEMGFLLGRQVLQGLWQDGAEKGPGSRRLVQVRWVGSLFGMHDSCLCFPHAFKLNGTN